MRENKNVALHVICGDITNVELQGKKLILKVQEQFLYDMITAEENKNEIKKALLWQGLDLELEFIKMKKDSDLVDEDLAKLSAIGVKFRKV